MWKNKNNKIHIREADSTDEDELLGDLKVKNKITSFDIEHPNHRKKARRRSEALLEKEKLPPRQLDQREDDGTSLGMKWWETINPCRKDPYIQTSATFQCCYCFRCNALVILFFYTLIGGTCAAFGIFYFFASILEFAEHYFFYADEFMAIAITMALCGIWIGSKTIWVAHNVGHNAEALAWAPCWCPGFPCHKCCLAKKERNLFYKQRCTKCCECRKMWRRYRRRQRRKQEEDEEIEALAANITTNNLLDEEEENDKIYFNENDVGYSKEEYKRRISVNIEKLKLEIQRKEIALKMKRDKIEKQMLEEQAARRIEIDANNTDSSDAYNVMPSPTSIKRKKKKKKKKKKLSKKKRKHSVDEEEEEAMNISTYVAEVEDSNISKWSKHKLERKKKHESLKARKMKDIKKNDESIEVGREKSDGKKKKKKRKSHKKSREKKKSLNITSEQNTLQNNGVNDRNNNSLTLTGTIGSSNNNNIGGRVNLLKGGTLNRSNNIRMNVNNNKQQEVNDNNAMKSQTKLPPIPRPPPPTKTKNQGLQQQPSSIVKDDEQKV